MEDRTGIDRTRRLETKADTESNEDERGIGYVAEKDDERDDEKTTKRRETERR